MARPAGAKRAPLYSVHPGVVMMQKWVSELEAKTGRSLDAWIALVRRHGPNEVKARREWLETTHKLGTNSASWIAERASGKGGELSEPASYLEAAAQYVEVQYAGAKSRLRPVYDALLDLAKATGDDVRACPCKTIVPLYRQHVFAQIKPTTNTRVDLGVALAKYKGKLPKRIIDTGGLAKKDRITHRIEVRAPSEIDREVEKWLRTAYELDGHE